jgi:hypothetical protein
VAGVACVAGEAWLARSSCSRRARCTSTLTVGIHHDRVRVGAIAAVWVVHGRGCWQQQRQQRWQQRAHLACRAILHTSRREKKQSYGTSTRTYVRTIHYVAYVYSKYTARIFMGARGAAARELFMYLARYVNTDAATTDQPGLSR